MTTQHILDHARDIDAYGEQCRRDGFDAAVKSMRFVVRHDHEYGEFFVNESEPTKRSDGHLDYAATWVCYSSFGTFGHHWSSMGSPFAEFICQVDEHYLLGKIARKFTSGSKAANGVLEALKEKLSSGRISQDQFDDAEMAVHDAEDACDGGAVCHMLYESDEIHSCGIEFTDIETQEWDGQAVGFVRKLWPKFVEAVNAAAGQRLAECSSGELMEVMREGER